MSEKPSSSKTKKSSWALLAIFATLALSVAALILGFNFLPKITGYYLLLLGFVGTALSAYILFQARSKMKNVDIEPPTILTTVECRKCDYKNVRDFKRGDYIFKEMEPCQKCDENMLITAIYREPTQEEKETPF